MENTLRLKNNQLWLLLNKENMKNLPEMFGNYGYKLSEGDLIKFGKAKFIIK